MAESLPDEPPEPTRRRAALTTAIAVVVFAAVLVTLFYAIENRRGLRAWRNHKAALAAKGRPLEWKTFIPDAPPDASNVLKYGTVADWIYKVAPKPSPAAPPSPGYRSAILSAPTKSKPTILRDARFQLGSIEIVPISTGAISLADIKTDPIARSKALDGILGLRFNSPLGPTVYARSDSRPAFRLAAANVPNANELADALQMETPGFASCAVAVEPITPTTFAVYGDDLTWLEATRYLEKGEFVARLNELRQAARRPFVYLDGDYSSPNTAPIQNFIAVRQCAQAAGARALCYLALRKPDEAFQELSSISDVRRTLEPKPYNLVMVMIDFAVVGIRNNVIEAGFASSLWQPHHWQSFAREKPLDDAFERLRNSLHLERTATEFVIEADGARSFSEFFKTSGDKPRWLREDIQLRLMPRGWLYLGLTRYSELLEETLAAIGKNDRVYPEQLKATSDRMELAAASGHPSRIVTAVALPNCEKAVFNATRHKTFANFTGIAGSLELYKSQTGSYPDSLPSLVPRFASSIPTDFVTGAPIAYRRIENSYALYTTGWNRRDDFRPLVEAFEHDPSRQFFLFDPAAADDFVWRGSPPVERRALRPAAANH